MGVLVASRVNPLCKENNCGLEALVEIDLIDASEG